MSEEILRSKPDEVAKRESAEDLNIIMCNMPPAIYDTLVKLNEHYKVEEKLNIPGFLKDVYQIQSLGYADFPGVDKLLKAFGRSKQSLILESVFDVLQQNADLDDVDSMKKNIQALKMLGLDGLPQAGIQIVSLNENYHLEIKPDPLEAIVETVRKMPLSTPDEREEFLGTAILLHQHDLTSDPKVREVLSSHSLESRYPPVQILDLTGALIERINEAGQQIEQEQDSIVKADIIEKLRIVLGVTRLLEIAKGIPEVEKYLQLEEKLLEKTAITKPASEVTDTKTPDTTNEIVRLKPEKLKELIQQGKIEVLSTPERAKEILGKDFLGVEAIKNLENGLRKIGVKVNFVIDKLPPFLYTEEDLQTAKAFGEMLVLRPEEMIRDGIRLPLTLIGFRELFQEDPLGKLQSIHKMDDDKREYKKDWYKTQHFATDQEGVKLGWSLVKKEALDGSNNKSWIDQEQFLIKYEADLKLKGAKHISTRRRTATEAMYDILLYYVNTGERLLANIGDWGETPTDAGRAACLIFRGDGLAIYNARLDVSNNQYMGLCPTRPVEAVVPNKTSIEKAQQIFGKDFFGPDQVEKTFSVKLERHDIPVIPFSQQELEKAKELGQFLILRTDKAPKEKPLTMEKMEQLLKYRFEFEEKKGRVLLNTIFFTTAWYIISQDFFKKDIPRVGWALVSKDVISKSTGKTYLQQTEILADYLIDLLKGDRLAHRRFLNELLEFNAQKDALTQISDPKEVNKKLSELKLNQATRHTPTEALYDLLVYFENTGQRLLENIYTWTSKCDSEGKLITIGDFRTRGIRLDHYSANEALEAVKDTGVLFSRQF